MMKTSTQRKTRAVLVVSLGLIFVAILITIFAASRATRAVSAEKQLIARLHPTFTPLLPAHLPVGARLLTDDASSYYNSSSRLLILRWVFPAQTLPGQGTLIIYQAQAGVSFLMPVRRDKTVQINGQDGVLGDLTLGADIPSSPGRRAASFRQNGQQIVVVTYAIGDDELLKVAQSLQ